MTSQDAAVRKALLAFLEGGLAHASLDDALKGMPMNLAGTRPTGAPHSAWELLEHIRRTLEDLVEFSTNPDYRALKWPDDYWPAHPAPASAKEWETSVRQTKDVMRRFESLLNDPGVDLVARIPWGKDQTILREVLLAIDHTGYHVGQLVLVRKQLEAWKS